MKAELDIKTLENALKLFKLDNAFYPSTEQGIGALVEQPSVGRISKNWREGGYLEKGMVPEDPWGNIYYLESNRRGYTVGSMRPDGIQGNADDITEERRYGR